MEYNRSKKPCWNGVRCYRMRNGEQCRFYHPQEHLDQIARQNNSHNHISTQQSGFNHHRTFPLQQYPTNPTTYGLGQGPNSTSTHRNNQSRHTSGIRSDNRHRNNHSRTYGHTHQQNPNFSGQRINQNTDRQRSRDLINPNPSNNPQYHNHSPEHTYNKRNFKKQNRHSPQYNTLPYKTHPNNQNNQNNQNNMKDTSRSNYPEVKPQKNQIKLNFTKTENQKMEEQSQTSQSNYQPDLALQSQLAELFPPEAPQIDMEKFLQIATEAHRRQALAQRQARQFRQMRMRRNQNRYFYSNDRLIEENRRMIEQNRIEEEERRRFEQEYPTMQELTGPVQYRGRRRSSNHWSEESIDFYDDYYQVVQGWYYDQEEEVFEATEENFHWFVRRCKYFDPRTLTPAQAELFDKCLICQYSYKDKQDESEQLRMILQLYCDDKHHMHKSCGVQWLQKSIENPQHLTNKSTCPLCRQDFRNHQAFAKDDPNYLNRFIPRPQEPQQQIQQMNLYEQQQMINWNRELNRFYNPNLDDGSRFRRFRQVIEAAQAEDRRMEERRQRRLRRRIQAEQSESESQESSHSESRRLQPEQEESNMREEEGNREEEENEIRDANPEQNKKFWEDYYNAEPESNPFSKKQSACEESQPGSQEQQ